MQTLYEVDYSPIEIINSFYSMVDSSAFGDCLTADQEVKGRLSASLLTHSNGNKCYVFIVGENPKNQAERLIRKGINLKEKPININSLGDLSKRLGYQ